MQSQTDYNTIGQTTIIQRNDFPVLVCCCAADYYGVLNVWIQIIPLRWGRAQIIVCFPARSKNHSQQLIQVNISRHDCTKLHLISSATRAHQDANTCHGTMSSFQEPPGVSNWGYISVHSGTPPDSSISRACEMLVNTFAGAAGKVRRRLLHQFVRQLWFPPVVLASRHVPSSGFLLASLSSTCPPI